MNICFVIGTLQYSGAEKIVRSLIEHLYSDGYKISVILLSCSEKYSNLNYINQYPLFINKSNRLFRIFTRIKKIHDVLKKNKFDAVVSFGVKFNLDVASAIRGTNTKLILCERNDPIYDPSSIAQRIRRKIVYNYADGYVFQTKEIQSFFNSKIISKSVIIPNFIDDLPKKNELYCPEKKSFVTVARLDNNQKDQKSLLQAFSIFNSKYPDYSLDFLGDGPDKEEYIKLAKKLGISDRVNFLGKISNPLECMKYYEAFVLTSKYEGMPNALMEAMSIGMPCISTNCSGGGANFLISDNCGILVPIGDVNGIVDAMCKVVEDKNYSKMLGNNALKKIEKLNSNSIIKKWENYIIEIAGDKHE